MFFSLCSECCSTVFIFNSRNLFYFQAANKINFETDCLPSERMNLPLLASEVADDINTNEKEEIPDGVEGMELHSSVTAQDVLMSSPEKNIPSQNDILQEEKTKISQSGKLF